VSRPIALDFSTAAKFFPFAVAREGFDVLCLDQDTVCGEGSNAPGNA